MAEDHWERGEKPPWRIGQLTPVAGYRFSVFLTIAHDENDLLQAVCRLAITQQTRFMLFTPRGRMLSKECRQLLHQHHGCFLPLVETSGLDHDGRLAASEIGRIAKACKWTRRGDISASDMHRHLGNLRGQGYSVQTSNHYLRAIKEFSRWLVADRWARKDRLLHLSMLNTRLDRRHDRRALSPEEFARLVDAAQTGPSVESIPGPDGAVMYVLAAWTGYRRSEIGSLTLRSLRLDDDPPTATVAAGYGKRRRQDMQVLHPEVVKRLQIWLATKGKIAPQSPLFPVSERVPGGTSRKTSKMMRRNLAGARKKWLEEAATAEEQKRREQSDFLAYQDHNGRFADFHSNRHTFITNLERAGVSPRVAQTLARHSDIRLTMGIYTHVELHDQTVAITSLPAPPSGLPGVNDGATAPRKKRPA